jgi:hypothetical protein
MDLTWAAEQLREFQRLSQFPTPAEVTARLRGQELIVHKFADLVWPDWRSWEFPNYQRWWGRSYDLVSRIVDSLPFPRQLLAPDQEVHRHEYEANQ